MRLARASERVGGSDHLGALAAKRDQRDTVAPHVAIDQQKFDRALDLGEPLHRRRARRIDDKNRGRASALAEADDAEVLGAHLHAPRVAGRAPAQLLPRRGGAQRINQTEPAFAQRAAARADGPSAQLRGHVRARLARLRVGRTLRDAKLNLPEQIRRDRRARGGEHEIGEVVGGDFVRAFLGGLVGALARPAASGSSDDSSSEGASSAGAGTRVARGPSTSPAASAISASSMSSPPRKAEAARAARRASSGARSEATPS